MNNLEVQKKIKILSAIARIHRSLGAHLEIENVSRILIEEIVEIIGCDAAAIILIEGNNVKVKAEKGFPKKLRENEFDITTAAIKYITNTKQSIYTGNVTNTPIASCAPSGLVMKSLMCVPIEINGEVRGIIHLDSQKKNAFDKEDLNFVKLLAREMSIALERSFLYSKIKALSIKDPLTGCLNRRKLDEDIKLEINRSQRYERTFSLLMIDIDWFKKYNDFNGHQKGDELLKKLVKLLTKNLRIADKVYRYGGEEFAILLPETNKEEALLLAEKLRSIVEQEKFEKEENSQPNKKITISIGVAAFPSDGSNKDSLIKAADTALYRAKQSGRNRVFVS